MKIHRETIRLLTKAEALETISESIGRAGSALLENVSAYCADALGRDRALKIKQQLMDAGLMEFEAVQLVDSRPRSLLCLQLVIEEMEDRFSEDNLQKMLRLFE